MMQVGPHDAATNLCGWIEHVIPSCLTWLPSNFDKWGWIAPITFFAGGLIWFFWPAKGGQGAVSEAETQMALLASDDQLLLRDAAVAVIEKIEARGLLDVLLGKNTSSEEKIEHIIFGFLTSGAQIFGKRHPSTKCLEISKDKLLVLHPVDGFNELQSDFASDRTRYTDVRIKKSDADEFAARLVGRSSLEI
jgi:hypothetical protein